MNYIIGKILDQHVKSSGYKYRIYAIDHDMLESEFALIRKGHRAASAEKLATLMDIELLREPVIKETKELLNTLDTELLIQIYNLIYAKERKK